MINEQDDESYGIDAVGGRFVGEEDGRKREEREKWQNASHLCFCIC